MNGTLMRYSPVMQHYGTFLKGYPWQIYGCGTYREPVSKNRAEVLWKRFVEHLTKRVRQPVAYAAALEGRFSGLGDSPVPVHWHYLAACPRPTDLQEQAEELWEEKFGITAVSYT